MIEFVGFYRVLHVVDGDGFTAVNTISNEIIEFRLYGIDAPEIKFCSKLKKDEKETHIAGSLLIHLGHLAASYLRSILQKDEVVSIKQESQNKTDKYGRWLCYAYLPDGICINESLVANGYAKAFSDFYCAELPRYQILNTLAKQKQRGLYSISRIF